MTEEIKWYSIMVEAELSLLPSSVSGRTSGITSKYRPNHNFGSPENNEMRMGEITVPNNKWIEPGQTANVLIHFTMPDGYVIDLKPGLRWRVQEGGNHVGNGKIIRVFASDVPDKLERT